MVPITVYLPEDLLDEVETRNLLVADVVLDALRAELGRLSKLETTDPTRDDPPTIAAHETSWRVFGRGAVCDGPWLSGVDGVLNVSGCDCDLCAAVDLQLQGVTRAELRVLGFMNTHLSLADIGVQLHISRTTVKSHVAALYQKLGVGSRAEMVAVLGIPSQPIKINGDRMSTAETAARSA